MGGGAWPFLVGGATCLVNSDNERDLNLLNSYANLAAWFGGGVGFGPSLSCLAVVCGQLLRGTVGV